MTKKNVLVFLLYAMAISCSKPADSTMMDAADASAKSIASSPIAADATETKSQENLPQKNGMIAYAYEITVVIPEDKLSKIMSKHRQMCEQAGYNKCQLIKSQINDYVDTKFADLSIRAEPAFLANYRKEIENDAKLNDGKITNATTESEDLTRVINDAEATLNAQIILRDRIQNIIKNNPAKLSDLLEAEKELARVQGEIESINTNLKLSRERVDMSVLNLHYQAKQGVLSYNVFEPVAEAFESFFAIMAKSLSVLIYMIAGILPFAIIFIPLGIYMRKILKDRALKKQHSAKP